jgi:hypothetical protein
MLQQCGVSFSNLTQNSSGAAKEDSSTEYDEWELPKPSFKKKKLDFAGIVKKISKIVNRLKMQQHNEVVSEEDLRVTLMTNKRQQNDNNDEHC